MSTIEKFVSMVEIALDNDAYVEQRKQFHKLLTAYHDTFVAMQAVLLRRSTFRSEMGRAQMDVLLKQHCDHQAAVVKEGTVFLAHFAQQLITSAGIKLTEEQFNQGLKCLVDNYLTVDEACQLPTQKVLDETP